jgi:hypothetical protein
MLARLSDFGPRRDLKIKLPTREMPAWHDDDF